MDLGTVLRRGELPFQVLADETIVVHPRTHEVHVLNPTGSRIWALLDAPRPVSALLAALEEEYDGPADLVRQDVERFVEELLERRLVVADGGAARGAP